MVYLPRTADVIMTGDFYRSIGYPNIDRANGGSLKGMLDGFNAVDQSRQADDEDRPRPWRHRRQGGGRRAPRHDHRDPRQGRDAGQQGKTLEEVVAAKPTADYDAKVPQPGTTGERFIGQFYAEIKGAR